MTISTPCLISSRHWACEASFLSVAREPVAKNAVRLPAFLPPYFRFSASNSRWRKIALPGSPTTQAENMSTA